MAKDRWRKACLRRVDHQPVAIVPNAPNPPAGQCATAKGHFGVYFLDSGQAGYKIIIQGVETKSFWATYLPTYLVRK